MGQRLGRHTSHNLSFDSVDQQKQLPPESVRTTSPCVSAASTNASRQPITPSTTTPAIIHSAAAAVIIKIQLLKMESNNLNGNGNGAKAIVDQTTTTSLVGAYEQLALRPPADVAVAAAVVPPNNSTEYVPMAAVPRINSSSSRNNNSLIRSLAGSSESDNTISNSLNSICSSSNNNAAGTLNTVCDSNKINNLSKAGQASQPQQLPQSNQRNFNITTSEPNREIYTMMYAANTGGTSGGSAQQIVQDEDMASAVDTRNSCNHCSRRRTLAALARRSRVCKLCHESLDDNAGSNKSKEKANGKDKDGAKSKKGNWGIKFNCAKLRGNSSKASTSAAVPTPAPPSPPVSNVSSDSLTSPSYTNLLMPTEAARTFDSCVCTGYRKVDDSESERSESEYDVRPQHVTTTRTSVSLFSTTTTMGPEGTTSRTSTIVLPDHRTTTSIPANFVATAPTATSLTVATMSCNGQVIQRFERTDHYGNTPSLGTNNVILVSVNPPMIDVTKFNADDYPIEDCDEQARRQRAYEIAEGVEPPPGFQPSPTSTIVLNPSAVTTTTTGPLPCAATLAYNSPMNVTQWCTPDAFQELMNLQMATGGNTTTTRIHSQVDYIHCLVPDLQKITGCCFYWGKMDRYEAEKLLEGKPEGTFLLRDSAQEDFLFSVSFRKYGRSLHARIEQFNHKFSFDSHDPGVYTASTVTGLLEHYKDPSCVMFFEPMLTLPLNRNFCFSLQQLCRATIVSHITYDGINDLCLPQRLRSYLQEYHYKQRLRVKKFDGDGIYGKTS